MEFVVRKLTLEESTQADIEEYRAMSRAQRLRILVQLLLDEWAWKRGLLESLNANGVEYVIVGTFALAMYGRPRFATVLDILIQPNTENSARFFEALAQWGLGSPDLSRASFREPRQVMRLGVDPNRVDVRTSISGIDNADVWRGRVAAELDGVPVYFISREHFLVNKRAVGRPQDLADVADVEAVSPRC